ncbi:MAG: LPS export ABC transporter permease LptF [Pseudomonadota bacterium]
MGRFDRYLLAQLLALFGFFSLVLVGVYWINRAVVLFDQLIGDGQSALVFLEFSLLTLPNVIRLVLPISAFAATVYVINRLAAESELVVVQATGFSVMRLARPILIFGGIVAAMLLVLTHLLVPASRSALALRTAEITENVTARFLNEGQFMHPSSGVTIYIKTIAPNGELRDLFLSDDRNAENRVVYTARRALLVRGEKGDGSGVTTGPKLLMFDGISQTVSGPDRRLAITRFADFTYDLAALIKIGSRTGRSIEELPTLTLLTPTPDVLAEIGKSRAAFLQEAHARFATPLLAPMGAALAFACLMLGGFSRFGLWRQIAVAVGLLILAQMANTAATSAAMRSDQAWPLVYATPVLGLLIAFALMVYAQMPRRRPHDTAAGLATRPAA